MVKLTKRESEILDLVALGYSDEGIADKLFISRTTVATHLHNIYTKKGIFLDRTYNPRTLLIAQYIKEKFLKEE